MLSNNFSVVLKRTFKSLSKNILNISLCLLPTSGYIPGIGIPQNCPNTPTLQNVQKFLTYNPSEISINNQNNTMTIPKFYSSPSVAAAAKVRHGTHSDSHAFYLESKNHGYDEGGRFCGVRVKCSKKTVYLASMGKWF